MLVSVKIKNGKSHQEHKVQLRGIKLYPKIQKYYKSQIQNIKLITTIFNQTIVILYCYN